MRIINQSFPPDGFFIRTSANRPLEPVAHQPEFQIAARDLGGGGLLALEFESAFVPNLHFPGAVISTGNFTFEFGVAERVIFSTCTASQGFSPRSSGVAFGNGPGSQRAVYFQPEIAMETPRRMPLHHEARRGGLGLAPGVFPRSVDFLL